MSLPPDYWYFIIFLGGGTLFAALLGSIGDWLTRRERPTRKRKSHDRLPPAETDIS